MSTRVLELGLLFLLILAFYCLLKFSGARYLFLFLTSILILVGVHSVEYYHHFPEKSLKLIRDGQNYFVECVEKGGKLSLIVPQASTHAKQLVINNGEVLVEYNRFSLTLLPLKLFDIPSIILLNSS